MTNKKRFFPTLFALTCTLILLAIVLNGCGESGGNVRNSSNSDKTALVTPSPTPVSFSCLSKEDADITNAIYDELKRQGLAGERWKINVYVSRKVITITGWSPSDVSIIDLIRNTAIGCSISAESKFYSTREGLHAIGRAVTCANGLVPCGDVCVPSGQCAMTLTDPVPLGTSNVNVSSNSNMNANRISNTNSNSNTNRTINGGTNNRVNSAP